MAPGEPRARTHGSAADDNRRPEMSPRHPWTIVVTRSVTAAVGTTTTRRTRIRHHEENVSGGAAVATAFDERSSADTDSRHPSMQPIRPQLVRLAGIVGGCHRAGKGERWFCSRGSTFGRRTAKPASRNRRSGAVLGPRSGVVVGAARWWIGVDSVGRRRPAVTPRGPDVSALASVARRVGSSAGVRVATPDRALLFETGVGIGNQLRAGRPSTRCSNSALRRGAQLRTAS